MEHKGTQYEEMRIMICELVDGTITPDRMATLNHIFARDPEAVNHYIDFLDIQVLTKSNMSNIENDLSIPLYSDEIQELTELWHQLAKEEMLSPEIEIPEEEPERELIQKVVYSSREKQKISNWRVVTLMTAVAAVVFMALFIHFVPPKGGVEVATLLDTINAKWIDTNQSIKKGDRFIAGTSYSLSREGFAKLLFDNSAVVTVEGPAEFQIVSEDRIKLLYGRLYSIVSQEALGFSVDTPSAMVIDLGTQFGVQVGFQGDTQLHVIEGKTTLVAGKKKNKVSLEVSEGTAQKIDGATSAVSKIPYNDSIFVRQINSDKRLIWRGQNTISLADIVGGGDGFGTGQLEKGIDLLTGDIVEKASCEARSGNGKYLPVPQNRYIDGVFVPDNQGSSVCVTSQGHLFDQCPPTNNLTFTEIANSRVDGFPSLWSNDIPVNSIYGSGVCPCISLHANSGITFDLNAIRADFMGTEITRFVAGVGLSPVIIRQGNIDVWVLVDGEVRFCQRRISEAGTAYPVDVELKASDRFLTLVTTDGEDVDVLEPAKRASDSDWGIIVQPRLELQFPVEK